MAHKKDKLKKLKRFLFIDEASDNLRDKLDNVSQEVCDKLSKLHKSSQELITRERSHLRSKA